jgi:hypothetical protein
MEGSVTADYIDLSTEHLADSAQVRAPDNVGSPRWPVRH